MTEIGHKVGAALVGTFLGILASYGFLGPLAGKMESMGEEEGCYFRTLSCIMQGYFGGMQPKMAVETGRRACLATCDLPPKRWKLSSNKSIPQEPNPDLMDFGFYCFG